MKKIRLIIASIVAPLTLTFVIFPSFFFIFGTIVFSNIGLLYTFFGLFVCSIMSAFLIKSKLKYSEKNLICWMTCMLLTTVLFGSQAFINDFSLNSLLFWSIMGFLMSQPFYLIFWLIGVKKYHQRMIHENN